MTPHAALPGAVARLAAAGVPDAARDARLLLAYAMGIGADRLTLHLHDSLTPDTARRFDAALGARETRQPVAQIIGRRCFWGRDFAVTADVLDPRPDTESLIVEALAAPFARVLDLGTGSGAIGLTLLAERPQATAVLTDLSAPALAVARGNAQRLDVIARATFLASDWFAALGGRFDLIASNPPYIAEAEMRHLAPDVREHEPRMALTPGGDGLDAYRAICAGAGRHLSPGGRIVLETGPAQGAAVRALLAVAGFQAIRILPDLDGRDRVVAAIWPE